MCWECVLVRHSAPAAREQLEEMSLRVELTSPGWQRALYPLGNINSPAFSLFETVFHYLGYSQPPDSRLHLPSLENHWCAIIHSQISYGYLKK